MTVFGPIVAERNVADAVVAHLSRWVRPILREIEDQNDMQPGALYRPRYDGDAFYQAVDVNAWTADSLPAYIVVVAPDGLEHSERGYAGWFRVVIAVVGHLPTEDEMLSILSFHGAAVMAAMLQNGSLGGFSKRTEMADPPHVVLFDDDGSLMGRSEAAYRVLVDTIVDDGAGPLAPPEDVDELVPDWPTVEEDGATFTLTPLPLTEDEDEEL